MNGRVYDPGLGRFMSADPVVQDMSNAQNFDRYTYVLNSPLSFEDPNGFQYLSGGFDHPAGSGMTICYNIGPESFNGGCGGFFNSTGSFEAGLDEYLLQNYLEVILVELVESEIAAKTACFPDPSAAECGDIEKTTNQNGRSRDSEDSGFNISFKGVDLSGPFVGPQRVDDSDLFPERLAEQGTKIEDALTSDELKTVAESLNNLARKMIDELPGISDYIDNQEKNGRRINEKDAEL